MDSAGVSSSPFHSFKAKKVRRSSINKQHTHPPRRSLTRRQVSQAANHLRNLDLNSKPSVSSLKASATIITNPNTSKTLPQSSTEVDCVSIDPSPGKLCAKLPETPIKSFDLEKQGDISSMDGTPPELILGSSTPPAPRKMYPTITQFTKRSRCRRSLNFDSVMKNKMPPSSSDYDDDIIRDLPASIQENKRKRLEKNDPKILEANWRKQMISRLPQLVDSILDIFILCTSMTKEEVVYKISTRHMVEGREVDEQLRLMLELAPEWIQEEMFTGHICVDKTFSRESILTRLSQATN